MNIPPFWVRERRIIGKHSIRLRGWSTISQQEAEARLAERAALWQQYLSQPASAVGVERFRAALRCLDEVSSPYSAAILEPVEQQVSAADIITRNRYGCLVLNSVSHCFLDVDRFPGGFWAFLFGGKDKEEQRLIRAIQQLCAQDASLSVRLYRTAHGWRVMVRAEGLVLGSAKESSLFEALHVDALYANLCRRQMCWRARLSPKPFYRGLKRYPAPLSSRLRADEWIAEYERKTAGLAVCRLVDVFGPAWMDDIIELHDCATGARRSDIELA
ncbi:MAG: hypothetical protein IJB33_04745 [Akkermansia sp.]|nr:hypothetical protein [Akkermansia sp.]